MAIVECEVWFGFRNNLGKYGKLIGKVTRQSKIGNRTGNMIKARCDRSQEININISPRIRVAGIMGTCFSYRKFDCCTGNR